MTTFNQSHRAAITELGDVLEMVKDVLPAIDTAVKTTNDASMRMALHLLSNQLRTKLRTAVPIYEAAVPAFSPNRRAIENSPPTG